MKRISLAIVLIIIAAGAILMLSRYGMIGGLEYNKYSSKDPDLNIALEYVSGWSHVEHKGSGGSYSQVIFVEAKKEEGFKAHMAVTVKKASADGLSIVSVEAALQDILSKRLKLKDAKVLSKYKTRVCATQAAGIELSYKALNNLYKADAGLIPVKERVVILKRDGKIYIIKYENTAKEFDRYDRAFSRLVRTLRFKDAK